jgi:hypothetical protein
MVPVSNTVSFDSLLPSSSSTIISGFVGYDPSLKTVIVGHQGTDASKM